MDTPGPAGGGIDDAADFERLGLYDPRRPDAAERLSLLRYAVAVGASSEELTARSNLGDLIIDLKMRPRLDLTLAQAIADTPLTWPDAQEHPS